MSKVTHIKPRRRLAELYAKGTEVRFSEAGIVNSPTLGEEPEGWEAPENPIRPSEDDIVVWVQPPNPLQREQALREASAKRARAVVRAKKDPDSDYALDSRAFAAELETDELIEFVLDLDEAERQQEAQRDVLGEEEWEDFTELQDAMRQYYDQGEPEGEEWEALLRRDIEFGRQVAQRARDLEEQSRESFKYVPRDDLEERAFDKRVEMSANQDFMAEYERWMLFYACRDPENKQVQFFESVEELRSMPEEVQVALGNALAEFINDERTAKNSQRAAAGSTQSTLPSEPETSESSTPAEATV